MVLLPKDSVNPTVKAIYAHYEKNQEDGLRPHLGASIIGRLCSREIWYHFRWADTKKWIGRLLRLVETGKREEARFVQNLRDINIEVLEFNANGDQLRVSFFGGHFGGSLDAIAKGFRDVPETWLVVEMKTHNDKSFEKLKERGVRPAKPEHYAQMTVYMGGQGLDGAIYFALNKNTDELYVEYIEFDPNVFNGLLQKAQSIVFTDNAPMRLSNNPTYWDFSVSNGCKYCDFNAICHDKKTPLVNCRTCLHSEVMEDGHWGCVKLKKILTIDEQKLGCPNHLFLPSLLHDSEPIDAGETYVKYADGRTNLEGGIIV